MSILRYEGNLFSLRENPIRRGLFQAGQNMDKDHKLPTEHDLVEADRSTDTALRLGYTVTQPVKTCGVELAGDLDLAGMSHVVPKPPSNKRVKPHLNPEMEFDQINRILDLEVMEDRNQISSKFHEHVTPLITDNRLSKLKHSSPLVETRPRKLKHAIPLAETRPSKLKHPIPLAETKANKIKRTTPLAESKPSKIKRSSLLAESKPSKIKHTHPLAETRPSKIKHSSPLADTKPSKIKRTSQLAESKLSKIKHITPLAETRPSEIKHSTPLIHEIKPNKIKHTRPTPLAKTGQSKTKHTTILTERRPSKVKQTTPLGETRPSEINHSTPLDKSLKTRTLRQKQESGMFEVLSIVNGEIKTPGSKDSLGILSWLPACQRLSGFRGIEQRLVNLSPVVVVQCPAIKKENTAMAAGTLMASDIKTSKSDHQDVHIMTVSRTNNNHDIIEHIHVDNKGIVKKKQTKRPASPETIDPAKLSHEVPHSDRKKLRTRKAIDYYPKARTTSPIKTCSKEQSITKISGNEPNQTSNSSHNMESTSPVIHHMLEEKSVSPLCNINLSEFAKSARKLTSDLVETEFELDIDNIDIRNINECDARLSTETNPEPGESVEDHVEGGAKSDIRSSEEKPNNSTLLLPEQQQLGNECTEQTGEGLDNVDFESFLNFGKKEKCKSQNKTQSYLERFMRGEKHKNKSVNVTAEKTLENSVAKEDAHCLREQPKVDYMRTKIEYFGSPKTDKNHSERKDNKDKKGEEQVKVQTNTPPPINDKCFDMKKLSVLTICMEISANECFQVERSSQPTTSGEVFTAIDLGKHSAMDKALDAKVTANNTNIATVLKQKESEKGTGLMRLRASSPVNYYPNLVNYSRSREAEPVTDNVVITPIVAESLSRVKPYTEEESVVDSHNKPLVEVRNTDAVSNQKSVLDANISTYSELNSRGFKTEETNSKNKIGENVMDKPPHTIFEDTGNTDEKSEQNIAEEIVDSNVNDAVIADDTDSGIQGGSSLNQTFTLSDVSCVEDVSVNSTDDSAMRTEDCDMGIECRSMNQTYTVTDSSSQMSISASSSTDEPNNVISQQHVNENTRNASVTTDQSNIQFDSLQRSNMDGPEGDTLRLSEDVGRSDSSLPSLDTDSLIANAVMKETNKPFPCGAIVWGRFSKARWWPAIVIDGNLVRRHDKPGYLWLFWLSDRRLSQLKLSSVESFSQCYRDRASGKITGSMKLGIQRALEICADRTQLTLVGTPDVVEWSLSDVGYSALVDHVFNKDGCFPSRLVDTTVACIPHSVMEDIKHLGVPRPSYKHRETKVKTSDQNESDVPRLSPDSIMETARRAIGVPCVDDQLECSPASIDCRPAVQDISNDPSAGDTTKEWHMGITLESRNDIVRKIAQAIFPVPDNVLSTSTDDRIESLVSYSQKVESDIYVIANSKDEYNTLLVEKLFSVLTLLEDKRLEREGAARGDNMEGAARGDNMERVARGDDAALALPTSGCARECFSCEFPVTDSNMYNHPLFDGQICQHCRDALLISLYAKDDDGYMRFCGICGHGGQLFICDQATCGRVFCVPCVERHTSGDILTQIRKKAVWYCFLCRPFNPETHGRVTPHPDWPIQLVKFYQTHNIMLCEDLGYLTNPGKRKLRVLSLFDGIGTGKLVLDELGLDVEVYYASEIHDNAILVASYNHKMTQIGDALNLTRAKLKDLCPIDLVLGGPPCNDLSIVNPLRKGFNGTGMLLFKYLMIVKEVELLCQPTNHVFWLLENTGSMLTEFKEIICTLLCLEPALWDAKHFTAQRRARNFWGNIPGLYSTPDWCNQLEQEKQDLDSALVSNCNRKALVPHLRTITTGTNSLTVHNGEDQLPIAMNGREDGIWIMELERLFGFPEHYTDVGHISLSHRQKLIGKSWCVPVIKHLLAPLKRYFALRQE